MPDLRSWVGKGMDPVPGQPFGYAHAMEREAIRQHLLDRGWDAADMALHFRVVAIQERLHRHRPTMRQRGPWLQRQRDLQVLAPELTPDEWQAVADRFAGANDPLGQSILRKARHRARG